MGSGLLNVMGLAQDVPLTTTTIIHFTDYDQKVNYC